MSSSVPPAATKPAGPASGAGRGGKRHKVRSKPKGRAVDPKALEEVRALLGDAPRRRDLLIEHLHRIQDRYHYLSAAHLVALAAEMKMAMTEVYEVATFYHHFDVVKEGDTVPPAITVRVCDSIACELAGADALLSTLPTLLGSGIRVLHAPCVGRCETAPVAVIGQNPIPHATAQKVVAATQAGHVTHPRADEASMHPHFSIVTPGHIDYASYRAAGGYALAAECMAGTRSPADVIALMEDSGLRGLGGAGFPAGRKWKLVSAEPAPRLMAINIDEGEPGTFKDRYYLERDPHRFIEGALIAAWAVGIDAIYIYLRDEYHGCRAILGREIAALQKDPPCTLPAIHLRRGAGAYICGEESSMIESIEGKRGEPRLRPPYVAQVGLFGRPTLEHNMETLHWVRRFRAARTRLARRDIEGAKRVLGDDTSVSSDHGGWLALRARIAAEEGNSELARTLLSRAVGLDPLAEVVACEGYSEVPKSEPAAPVRPPRPTSPEFAQLCDGVRNDPGRTSGRDG